MQILSSGIRQISRHDRETRDSGPTFDPEIKGNVACDIQDVLRSKPEAHQDNLLREKNRKSILRRNLGNARQKTMINTFVTKIAEDLSGDGQEAVGRSSALGVVSHSSRPVLGNSSSVVPVETYR